ncbi:DUF1120 domain-containing protein [Pluralibacter gergoviae]|uniref:DUF1120 domain-containing protein n=1 Tax=Pluralibacter gergoviae TaxID=61647 RepID=A0AAW8HLC2_PLUGE|nr:DUF1120 domain-containing protein [Pluralibacter gergoviae]EKZ9516156.1 DUF1120 domain-containing protein [Pluralibacter gergoviae]ELC3018370.1 DUF1120 domain-containing protein [Pluralibacter gergoviae]ELC3023496.1 DUF1120 domain-containing protein [Pluralibacter gergoviae]ELO7479104.1 DUF1120 domain-containing protein [Pluralibacter gergoviae]ELW9441388.1 DUF1120 domain-containing protein [Pluralibacter gergoviae]
MNSLTKVALLALLAGQTMAAGRSVHIQITGESIPSACKPKIGGGATFDYGTLKAARLSANTFTLLEKKSLTFAIACAAPAKVQFRVNDVRKNSLAVPDNPRTAPFAIASASEGKFFGLGMAGASKTGVYAMRLEDVNIDGQIPPGLTGLVSTDGGTVWTTDSAVWLYSDGAKVSSIGQGSAVPAAFTTLTARLTVQAAINKTAELELNRAIGLDGLSALQIVYL